MLDKCKITGKNNQKLGRPISNHSLANQIPQLVKCQQKHMATIKHINDSFILPVASHWLQARNSLISIIDNQSNLDQSTRQYRSVATGTPNQDFQVTSNYVRAISFRCHKYFSQTMKVVVVAYRYSRGVSPNMTCSFQIGLFLLHIFSTFCFKKAKFRQKMQISRPEKCTFPPLMKVVFIKSSHHSAKKLFAGDC